MSSNEAVLHPQTTRMNKREKKSFTQKRVVSSGEGILVRIRLWSLAPAPPWISPPVPDDLRVPPRR
jgi:hypothetical protein